MRTVMLFSVLLLMACSGSRSTVQERRIQHRRHSNGWHIDLDARRREPRTRIRDLESRHANLPVLAPTVEERAPITAAATPAPPFTATLADQRAIKEAVRRTQLTGLPTALKPVIRQEEDENIMPRKKWNALAVPAFASGVSAIVLGFGTNLWLLIGAIVLTLVLAGWSIKRIRRREQAGKGFAIAALLIGVFAALLTIMSIVRYGTEL
ncbi:MAG: DUF4190 domain-containing protein [Flavobacteriales bacterium]|nr:DUF4190 domain-containing protein [Flavobacteriales bacterium]